MSELSMSHIFPRSTHLLHYLRAKPCCPGELQGDSYNPKQEIFCPFVFPSPSWHRRTHPRTFFNSTWSKNKKMRMSRGLQSMNLLSNSFFLMQTAKLSSYRKKPNCSECHPTVPACKYHSVTWAENWNWDWNSPFGIYPPHPWGSNGTLGTTNLKNSHFSLPLFKKETSKSDQWRGLEWLYSLSPLSFNSFWVSLANKGIT